MDYLRIDHKEMLEGFVARHLNAHRVVVQRMLTTSIVRVHWVRQYKKYAKYVHPMEQKLQPPALWSGEMPYVATTVSEHGACYVPLHLVRWLANDIDFKAAYRLALLLDAAQLVPEGSAFIVADAEPADGVPVTCNDGRTWERGGVVRVTLREKYGDREVELCDYMRGFPSESLRSRLLLLA